jgi:hypothetical protein
MTSDSIVLVDHTKVYPPPPGVLAAIAEALTTQIARDFAPLWGVAPITVRLSGPGEQLHFFDFAHSGDFGFHQVEASGQAFAHVAVGPSLTHGSDWLSGTDAVSASASHEVLEMLADPVANEYSFDGFGHLWAREVCDAVQERTYSIGAAGESVPVSDFVLPSFFNPWASRPFDHLEKLNAAFTLDHGGYAMVERATTDHERDARRLEPEFDPAVAEWRRDEHLHRLGRLWWRRQLRR